MAEESAGQPPELDPDQAALYREIVSGPRAKGPLRAGIVDEQGALRGPFGPMLLSPPIGRRLQALGLAIRFETSLTARQREAAVLVVAHAWTSTYERAIHEPLARAAGMTDKELDTLARGGTPPAEDFGVVVDTVRALVDAGRLGGELHARAVGALGARGLFELSSLVGYYATLALQLRVFGGE
jgi:4-carboxymuconolactone decarboxylase